MFDTVRHAALMKKMACLVLPDAIYNWINDLTSSRATHTAPKFFNTISELADIQTSVIQGSRLGPASFVVIASDLQPAHAGVTK